MARTGYTFVGWSPAAVSQTVHAAGRTFTIGTADVTLYAVWTAATAPPPSASSITVTPQAYLVVANGSTTVQAPQSATHLS